ncbi:MAG: GNAT family N-acetyltransferase [Oscillospiraceae bacterium]|jgi:RimJ/RimL family protein N-acetyltransferase|nr:GNAT family N-acetyltransferase [Oscillospiraceae bacterium]
MRHIGTRPIETERLTLRRATVDDAQDAYDRWTSDPRVSRFMRWTPHKDVAETRELLQKWAAEYEQPDRYHWFIARKEDDRPIGSIAIILTLPGDELAELGYCLGHAYWGQGYAAEAARAVLRYGLLDVGINRIEAYHALANPASGAVMRKAGMIREGMARQKYKSVAGFEDCGLYAIIRDDLLKGDK